MVLGVRCNHKHRKGRVRRPNAGRQLEPIRAGEDEVWAGDRKVCHRFVRGLDAACNLEVRRLLDGSPKSIWRRRIVVNEQDAVRHRGGRDRVRSEGRSVEPFKFTSCFVS